MLKKFREVNVFNGKPVDEDAPTNATGTAVADNGLLQMLVFSRRSFTIFPTMASMADVISLV